MWSEASQGVAEPSVLLIDGDEARGQRVAAALTLADVRAYVVTNPYLAMERALREQFSPDVVLLGKGDWTSRSTDVVMTRMLRRLRTQSGAPAQVLLAPYVTQASVLRTPEPMREALLPAPLRDELQALELVRQALPAARHDAMPTPHSVVMDRLPAYGLTPRVSQELRSKNSHFRQVLQAAQAVIAPEKWDTLLGDVGLAYYRQREHWPADTDDREIPAILLSCLNHAVELSAPADAPAQLRRWGETGSQLSLQKRTPSWVTQQVIKVMPRDRLIAVTLNGFTQEMNDIRGEDLHAWVARDDGNYWLVHYSNLYVYGRARRSMPACHVWLASIEATLRLTHLDETLTVREVECACQSQTGHCLFALELRETM